MWIVNTKANENGSHDDLRVNNSIIAVPDGWAVIPDDFEVPSTFPFVDIVAEDVVTYEKSVGIDGEDTQVPVHTFTVTSMTEGVMPEVEETDLFAVSKMDEIEAQVTYTALMTDTLLTAEVE